MNIQQKLCAFTVRGFHKGFYLFEDPLDALNTIVYSDFFQESNDDEFPYDSAYSFFSGSCHLFALSLNRLLDYRAYIIKGNGSNSFHAFCQIYKNSQWYYVDARGVTSSFDEFINDAKQFITNEYSIQPISEEDIKSWEQEPYFDDAMEFAKGIIKKYNSYYKI